MNAGPPSSLSPWLSVRDSARAVDFYSRAFGAQVAYRLDFPDGSVVARLSIGSSEFWLSDESPANGNYSPHTLGGATTRLILTVPDPDAAFQRAVSAGAEQVSPVTVEHGWRSGRLVDPFGHHWEIGRMLEENS